MEVTSWILRYVWINLKYGGGGGGGREAASKTELMME
jgi:hypothetical protein